MAQAFIKINGLVCPYPKRGLELMTATIVDAARNANGTTVGQRVGRDQYKINQLVWPALSAYQWSAILRQFSGFYATVTFPDMVYNRWKTLRMYPGDRTAEPYWVDESTGLPTLYINCKVNIIDCGE